NTRRLNQIYLRLSEDPDIPKATLLAAGTSRDQIDPVIEQLEGTMYVANDNCPHQVVIIGEEKVAEKAVTYLRDRGIPFEKLSFNRGYHTPLFSAICPHLREYFSAFTISPPQVEIYSCNTMAPYPTDPGKILKLAVETWVLPVAFRQTIENMHASGTRIFVEVGPKGNLTAFVEDILRGKPHLAIPSNVARRSGITQLNHMVGLLSAQGISLNLEYLYQYRSPQFLSWAEGNRVPASQGKGIKIPLGLYALHVQKHERKETAADRSSTEPSERISEVIGASRGTTVNRSDQAEWPGPAVISEMVSPELSDKGASEVSSQVRSMSPDFPSQSPHFSVMEQYFQTMDHFLDTQKEMMQAYLERGQNQDLPDPVWPDLLDADGKQTDQPEDTTEPEDTGEMDHPVGKAFQADIEKPLREEDASLAADESLIANEEQAHSSLITEEDISRVLMELVSEKTGYPQDMIDVNVDMEGDLGIDSIKRVEIIGSFRERYTHIGEEDVVTISSLKTLQQVIDFLKKKMETPQDPGKAPGTSQESITQNLPFTGTVVDLKPGKSLVIVREVNLQEDLFLEDHRFGQHISELDSSLGALPVIPLTVSLEIMAEAASLLMPGQKLIRVEKVSASQWICLEEEEPITLQITAEVLSQGKVQVRIQNLGRGSTPPSGQKPVITGEMFFAESYPSPSLPDEFILEEERPPSHTAEQVYSEHRMFHGPRFQGICSMDKVGKNGVKAHLQTLPSDHIFRSHPKPSFVTDPFLLDAAGQLVGYWPVEYLDSGFVIFPIAIQALHIYQEIPSPLNPLQTRMRLREVTNSKILADLDIFGVDGKLWVQIIGWQDWRFYWSKELYDFWRFPNRGFIGRLWEPPAKVVPEGEPSPSFSLLLQFWRGNDDLFQHVMAYMVLSRQEREIYHGLPAGKPQGEWLLKRMVAKDAVRSFIQKHYQSNLYPADIHLVDDEYGQPHMDKNRKGESWPIPNLSVACTEDAAAAMVAGKGPAVGIHLAKTLAHKGAGGAWELRSGEKTALSALAALGKTDQETWMRRLWIAKEAAARALGCQPTDETTRSITIQGFDLHSGWVRMNVEEPLREKKLPGHLDGPVQVFTTQEGKYIIAITIIEG
ncbi:MAG: polyketide synthase dehydratase domain-containing protein, partial [bacterium]